MYTQSETLFAPNMISKQGLDTLQAWLQTTFGHYLLDLHNHSHDHYPLLPCSYQRPLGSGQTGRLQAVVQTHLSPAGCYACY